MNKPPTPTTFDPRLDNIYSAKRELAVSVLRSFGRVRLRVTGFSMLPSLWPGDLVVIEPQPIGDIAPGEIVLFARHGRLISHRVVARNGQEATMGLITRGDAALAEDWEVGADELLGKVCRIERGGQSTEPGRRLTFPARLVAAVLSRCWPAAALLVRLRAMQRQRVRRQEALCPR